MRCRSGARLREGGGDAAGMGSVGVTPSPALFERLRAGGLELDTLSMGMSDDMEAAIEEGATMVRIGSAIFGPREKVKSAA